MSGGDVSARSEGALAAAVVAKKGLHFKFGAAASKAHIPGANFFYDKRS